MNQLQEETANRSVSEGHQAAVAMTLVNRWSRFGRIAGIALAAAVIAFFFFTPRMGLWRGLDIPEAWFNPEVNRAVDTLHLIEEPWKKISNPSNQAIQWRLFFPLLWHYTSLPVSLFLVLPHLGCLLVLGWVIHEFHQRVRCWSTAFMASCLVGTSSWFFVSTGWLTYFDSWFVLGLLCMAFARPWWVILPAAAITPWIDERVLFALPLVCMVRWADMKTAVNQAAHRHWLPWLSIVLPLVGYLGLRVCFLAGGSKDTTSQSYLERIWVEVAGVSLWRFVEGWWSGFRAAWFFAAILVWIAFSKRILSRFVAVLLAVVVISTILVGLVIAGDMSRSMMMLLPAVILGIFWAAQYRTALFRVALPLILVANLLLPASHVIWSFKLPIYYLYAELNNLNNPPSYLHPMFYVQRSQTLLNQNRMVDARRDLEIALKLDGDCGPAYFQRSILQLQEGSLAPAWEDAQQAYALMGNQPDLLLLRGVILRSVGKQLEAVIEWKQALQVAPADWPQRSQCQQMIQAVVAPGSAPANAPAPGSPSSSPAVP